MSKEGCLRRIEKYKRTNRPAMALAEQEFYDLHYGSEEKPKPKPEVEKTIKSK